MTIEITKKTLCKIGVVLIIIAAEIGLFYVGYAIGYDSGYDKAIADNENPKGNGIIFFAEEKSDTRANVFGNNVTHSYMVYHSTPNCEAIKNGVSMDRAYTDSTYRMNNSVFCPKCMDNALIRKCEMFLQEDFGE